MKTCKKCNLTKPLHDFYAAPTTADRLHSSCIPCARIAAAKNYAKPAANRAKKRAMKKKNKEYQSVGYFKKYRSENPEKIQGFVQQRKQQLIAASKNTTALDLQLIDLFSEVRDLISQKTGVTMSLDHVIPISKGGEHVASNIQIISKSMNASKGRSVAVSQYFALAVAQLKIINDLHARSISLSLAAERVIFLLETQKLLKK